MASKRKPYCPESLEQRLDRERKKLEQFDRDLLKKVNDLVDKLPKQQNGGANG